MYKNKSKGTQNTLATGDAGTAPPPYEIESVRINTKENMKNEYKEAGKHTCKCISKKKREPIHSWKSITEIYGDADTTEVWDEKNRIAEPLYEPVGSKSQPNERKTLNKKQCRRNSFIYLYKKRRKNKLKKSPDYLKTMSFPIEEPSESNEIRSPAFSFKLKKKPKSKPETLTYETGDPCIGGPCRQDLEQQIERNKLYSNKNEKPKKQKRIKKDKIHNNKDKIDSIENDTPFITTHPYIETLKNGNIANIGHGDQTVRTKKDTVNNVKCKYSFVKKLLSHTCACKREFERAQCTLTNAADQTGEPFFEIKVDSSEMRVLNSSEIKKKVQDFGKYNRKSSCICPSHVQRSKSRKVDVCKYGICEKAFKNKQTNFNCKCAKRNIDVIECKDAICDRKKIVPPTLKSKQKKRAQMLAFSDQNKPLFEVMLDPDMNILNTGEIDNVFKKSSSKERCATGICSNVDYDGDVMINCKCIRKKIFPLFSECNEEMCNYKKQPQKKRRVSFSSRIFSKSENWSDPYRRNVYRSNIKRRKHIGGKNINAKYNKRKGLVSNIISRDQNQKLEGLSDVWCKCFCECDDKKAKEKMKQKKKKNRDKKKKSKFQKRLAKYKKMIKKETKKNNKQTDEELLKCYLEQRKQCKKQVKLKEKEYKKNEKRERKEYLKYQKMQKWDTEGQNANCLTKFLSGCLNIGIESIKGIFMMVISLLTDPIGSYVYVKEKAKDPPGTIKRIRDWLAKTWTMKSSISQKIKESDTINVISDQIEDSAIYDTLFANKGKTEGERQIYETKSKLRKQRIQKRQDEAIYGCRHTLLTTMRKRPCLWFYHICPDLYPQCLSLLAFMNNFMHILIYLAAFICWTPCIVTFELCRAFMCCFLCTN